MKDSKKPAAEKACQKCDAATKTELGVIKVHENVIGDIVRKATKATDGVVRLAGSSLVDSIADIVHSRKLGDRSIGIEICEDTVSIAVKINVLYGRHIPTIAENVQKNVKEQVEKIAGMPVKQVDVLVQEIVDQATEEEEEEESKS